jgi:hypothetical protein
MISVKAYQLACWFLYLVTRRCGLRFVLAQSPVRLNWHTLFNAEQDRAIVSHSSELYLLPR